MWFKKKKTEAEEKTNFKERKDFKLTPELERKLLPFMEITNKMVSRMAYLQFNDKIIKDLRKSIDNASKSIAKLDVNNEKQLKLLDKLIKLRSDNEVSEQLLLNSDDQVQKLSVESQEMMLNPDFYKKVLPESYVITEKEIDNLDATEIEKMLAFFLTNIRTKSKNSTPFSMN